MIQLFRAGTTSRVETWDEVKTLSLFHGFGLLLELFKTHPSIRSWSYPEPGLFTLHGVPLYSGFMYAAVASYMIQAWRLLDIRILRYPDHRLSAVLAAAIYLNFFTHHFGPDLRWPLSLAVCWVFRHTWVGVTVLSEGPRRRMPLVVSFLLTGFFLWVAENAATWGGGLGLPGPAAGLATGRLGEGAQLEPAGDSELRLRGGPQALEGTASSPSVHLKAGRSLRN